MVAHLRLVSQGPPVVIKHSNFINNMEPSDYLTSQFSITQVNPLLHDNFATFRGT